MPQPTYTAVLGDGPMKGTRVEVDSLEGRPPKTLDLASLDGTEPCRYCLDGLTQGGTSANYTFLYRV